MIIVLIVIVVLFGLVVLFGVVFGYVFEKFKVEGDFIVE